MCVVKKQRAFLILFALIIVLAQFNCVEPIPVDTSDLALSSENGVTKDNSAMERDENLMKSQIKKRKEKRKKKKKLPKKDKQEDRDILADIASIFASFLSTVEDVTRDNEAIEVMQRIADSVNPP